MRIDAELLLRRRVKGRGRGGRRGTAGPWVGLEVLEQRVMLSGSTAAVPIGTPQLAVDINTIGAGLPNSSPVTSLTNFNGTLFFAANDNVNGTELWKSDGTAAGTVLVKDIDPGSGSSAPADFAVVGGKLFFMAYDGGAEGVELFCSDGTTAGTIKLTNVDFTEADSKGGATLPGIVDLNGVAYFDAPGGLWKSDGTVAGTVLVSSFTSRPINLINVNGTLFFEADDATHFQAIWTSDGTDAGTSLLFSGTQAVELTNVAGTLFFVSPDGSSGENLWKSNGTVGGTVVVDDLVSTGSHAVSSLTAAGDTLFFTFNDGPDGNELWKSNGTAAGTVMVNDLASGAASSSPTSLTAVGDTLFFATGTAINGDHLWMTNGTAAGTIGISSVTVAGDLTDVDGTLYFAASDSAHGVELWKSDGTPGGTVMVKDIQPGTGASSPASITAVGSEVFFTADDGLNGPELWMSDGTSGGTALVKNIYPNTAGSSPADLIAAGTNVFFFANDGVDGKQLWVSDGTPTGTVMLTTTDEGSDGYPTALATIGNTLFFVFSDSAHGTELWKSDGTLAGTEIVKDIAPGPLDSIPSLLTVVGSKLFFVANDDADGYDPQLWVTDGTAGNTIMLTSNSKGTTNNFGATSLAAVGNTLYFTFDSGATGNGLWKSDGTVDGTVEVFSGTGNHLIGAGDTLYFTANDGTHGTELWKSNGTSAGTLMVEDINPSSGSANPTDLTAVGSDLFFIASDGTDGNQLWITDGSSGGTKMLSSFNVNNDPVLADLTNVNGTLFFQGGELFGSAGIELWKSDGTAAGTSMVKDIYPGTDESSEPVSLTSVGGTLYFILTNSPASANQVWQSDGTDAGTFPITSSFITVPASLTAVNGNLFFVANDGIYGSELWEGKGGAPLITTSPQSQSVSAGADATFTAAATGTPTPSVQWFIDPAGYGVYSPINGATSATQDLGPATLDEQGNQYEAVFTNSAGVSTTVTAMLTVTAPAATQLVFSPASGSTQVNAAISPAVTVEIEDAQGDVLIGDDSNVTVAINTGSGNLGGTLTAAAVNGVATFSNLTLDTVDTYTLTASDSSDSLSGFVSGDFNITAPGPSVLVYTTEPVGANAGSKLPTVVVSIEDGDRNVVTSDDSTVTLTLNHGVFTGSSTVSVAAVNGVATFSNLTLDTAGFYQLAAAATDGLSDWNSTSFQVTPAAASQLVFTTPPAGGVAGATMAPVAVTVEDQFSNVETTDSSSVTLVVVTKPTGGAFTGSSTTSVNAISGVATFDNLAMTTAGTYTLKATDGGLVSVTSADLSVTAVPVGPVLTASTGTASYAQGVAAVVIDPGLTLTDGLSSTINSATVEITQNFASGEDALAFTDQSNITGSYSGDTLTLTGPATVAQFQAALRSVTYIDTSNNPSTQPRTVTFTATDDDSNTSNTATRTVTVVPANPLPDLTGEIIGILLNGKPITADDKLIPGDKVTVGLRVSNIGAGDATPGGQVSVALSASLSSTPGVGEIPIQIFTFANKGLAVGAQTSTGLTFLVPQTIATGDYFLHAYIDSNNDIPESNENNNVAVSDAAVPIVLEAGQVGGRSNVTLKFTVPNGTATPTPVTLTLAKGGTATVQIENNNALDIQVTSASPSSALTLTTGKGTTVTLNNITIGGVTPGVQPFAALAPGIHPAAVVTSPLVLKSFTATNGVLVGTFEIEGAIQTITIGQVSRGLIKIDAPQVGLTAAPLVLTIPVDIHNGSIDSAIPIKSLTTVAWIDDDGTPDFLKAPSIGTITTTGNKKAAIAGDFQAGVSGENDTATMLGSAKIAGSITGAMWNLTGVTSSIQVGGSVGGSDNPVSITAQSIKTLKVGGDLDNAMIQLTQAAGVDQPKVIDLGMLTIAGTLNDSVITSAGNVSTITLGAMDSSQLLIGTSNGTTGLASDSSAFVPAMPKLASLTVKGLVAGQTSLTDSIIDAWTIGKASLKFVDSAVEDNSFGIAADEIGSLTFQTIGVNNGKPVMLKSLDATDTLADELANPKKNPGKVALNFPLGSFTLRLV